MADHTRLPHGRKDLQANARQGNMLISMQLPWKPHFIRCYIFMILADGTGGKSNSGW
jgi:hypothetical protein